MNRDEIISKIANNLNVSNINIFDKIKGNENYLAVEVGKINTIYANVINKINNELSDDSEYKDRIILVEKQPQCWLNSNETKLLQQLLSKSLTVGKDNLKSSDFFVPFVEQENIKIDGEFNTIIYGRRGAGKSSLLLNIAKKYLLNDTAFAWIEMQQFACRNDLQVFPQFIYELIDILEEKGMSSLCAEKIKLIIYKLEELDEKINFHDIIKVIPLILRELRTFLKEKNKLFIFIDDYHLLDVNLQPSLLALLYAISRGNRIYLKITTIENLTRLYDANQSIGLQVPGDAQEIKLDHNLTDPHKSYIHLEKILNEYSVHVGLPSIKVLAKKIMIERLVWLSAGVPRDAIYILNSSITKAISKNRTKVALEDLNMAASDGLKEKENYINSLGEESNELKKLLNSIKDFCLNDIKLNAFSIPVVENDNYLNIKKLSDLKVLHILHPGFTPDRAGKKYEAYLLDFAFYTGFRRAQSVRDFKKDLKTPTSAELRKLKKYPL